MDNALSKKQRGRLKKLRKRALEGKEGCEISGLAVEADWNELKSLLQQTAGGKTNVIAPSLRRRRSTASSPDGTTHQNAEGVDHRDILFQFLDHASLSTTKKRKRDQVKSRIPAWATLHNPACVESMAVIEVSLPGQTAHNDTTTEQLLDKIPILAKLRKGNHDNLTAVPVTTSWFQKTSEPTSMTDVLAYFQREVTTEKPDQIENFKAGSCMTAKAIGALKNLKLTKAQLAKMGFPTMQQASSAADTKVNESITYLTEIVQIPSLTEAKTIAQKHTVKVTVHGKVTDHIDTYVSTSNSSSRPTKTEADVRVFGLDCEMVQSAKGIELARVTLIQLTGVENDKVKYKVVIDELVKPYALVLNYVTEYSGVTASMMAGVITRIEQIQAFFVKTLHADDILIGHSLENDLKALRIVHQSVVDTAQLFCASSGRKYSLKQLTSCLLNRSIQNSRGGHCSVEDALASLELAVNRSLKGEAFALQERSKKLNILELLSNRDDKPAIVYVGPNDWLKHHVLRFDSSAHALSCESIQGDNRKALGAWTSSTKRRARLAWGHFPTSIDSMATVDEMLADLLEKALPGTVTFVAFQCGLKEALDLSKERRARNDPRASLPWTDTEERKWQEANDFARRGFGLWISSPSMNETADSCTK